MSGLRLGYPYYVACDLSSEPTLEATEAVVQNLIFFLKGGRGHPHSNRTTPAVPLYLELFVTMRIGC